jgi:hypothetical protein
VSPLRKQCLSAGGNGHANRSIGGQQLLYSTVRRTELDEIGKVSHRATVKFSELAKKRWRELVVMAWVERNL